MRPAHKTISAGRLDGSRAGLVSHFEAALKLRASEPDPFERNRSPKPNLIRSFFYSLNEERYLSNMAKKLYVGNLAFQTTSQDLQELFAQAGTVESAQIIEDRDTGRSKGFAFVEMSTEEEAASAIDQFNGKEVAGRMLKVNEARPRENRGGGGGRGFGGGGGGRGFGGGGGGRGFGGGGGNRGGNSGRRSEPRW
jgi:RNA recognition motif-containing protein